METRYIRVRPSGPIHKVFVENGRRYSVEQCNIDDAAEFSLFVTRPEGRGCKHCNPDDVNVAPPMARFTQLPASPG
jgi:hypothetical protein